MAIVTGFGRGLGKAMAITDSGADIVVTARIEGNLLLTIHRNIDKKGCVNRA